MATMTLFVPGFLAQTPELPLQLFQVFVQKLLKIVPVLMMSCEVSD